MHFISTHKTPNIFPYSLRQNESGIYFLKQLFYYILFG